MYSIIKHHSLQFISWIIFIIGITTLVLLLNDWKASLLIIITSVCILSLAVCLGTIKNPGIQGVHALHEREKKSLRKDMERLKRENAAIAKELDFMKNQFNAHILFNFLNFCYSKVHKNSKNAAEAIEAFSDMLRYSLQIKPDENVPLKKEIEYLENYIRIQKCITNQVCINFKYEGCITEKLILPRILVTFVENAFKYGEINNEMHPIEIYLFADSHQVIFNVKNKKSLARRIGDPDPSHQTVKEMLDSFYGEQYQLKIMDTEWGYSSELVLKNG